MTSGVIELKIVEKLTNTFLPDILDVVNESSQHNVPEGSESHFKVVVISKAFKDQKLIQRHRAINSCLADELKNDIHALAIHTFTPKEWRETTDVPLSPKCLGGSKFDRV